jgi:hypothetical protein
MPAGAYAGTMMLLMAWLAMRFSHRNFRTYIIFGTQCGTIIASALLWKVSRSDKAGLFYGIFTLSTYGSGYGVLMGLHVANNSGYTKRSLASSGLYVGYCIGTSALSALLLFSQIPWSWLTLVMQATSSAPSSSSKIKRPSTTRVSR